MESNGTTSSDDNTGLQVFSGNYSWMLYGDDDTLFFIDSVSELLQDFDPSLPYIITGMGLLRENLLPQEALDSAAVMQ